MKVAAAAAALVLAGGSEGADVADFVAEEGAYAPATKAQDVAAGRVVEDTSVAGHEYVCAAGKYVQYDHVANSIGCAECPAGMYGKIDPTLKVKGLQGGGVCKFCPAGQSQWQAGQTMCLPIGGPPAPHETGNVDDKHALMINPDKSPGAPKLIPNRKRIIEHVMHDYSKSGAEGASNWYTKHGQNWWDYEGLQCGCKKCAYDELKHDFVCAGERVDPTTMHGGRVIITESKDAKFDKAGKFLPPKDVAYSVKQTKQCCQQRCVGSDYADCKIGCDLWMHHSSLNWESLKWHPVLRDKCAKDCSQGRLWQESLAKTASTYTSRHLVPKNEDVCKLGCNNYLVCMNLVNNKPNDAAIAGAASP